MDRLLLFEYLHADRVALHQAPASMRREGRAMLQALLDDATALPDTSVSVVLCDDAVTSFGQIPDGVAICPVRNHDELLLILTQAAASADYVLPVAPECDGILLNIARTLDALPCCTLLPSVSTVAICSDKLLTWEHFRAVGIPMLECRTDHDTSSEAVSPQTIFKLRQGAGCDGVQRGNLPPQASPEDYVQQDWLEAQSLSLGIIGGPAGPHLLPLAEQSIEWSGHSPRYLGGIIPADVPTMVREQVDSIVGRVLQRVGHFRGYTGLDFLVSAKDNTVYLNEINPRLCTSYVGYRHALSLNLPGLMIGHINSHPAQDHVRHVIFDASGTANAALPHP